MAEIDLKPLPPEEAVKFFRDKGFRPSFNWHDTWQEEHGRAFTVAKTLRVDVLQDIRREVHKAIAEGTTFEQFRKELTPLLQKKNWWGRQAMTDPKTGKTIMAQLGSPRRLRIIYDTNLRMARAAGRWEVAQRLKRSRPYLRYTAVLDTRTRPQHRAWHNIVRPVDDEFWHTHYPPNGWNCRCIVQSMNERDLTRLGLKVSPPPKFVTRRYTNRRTGTQTALPDGIDPGFGYNVGKSSLRGVTPPPRDGAPLLPAANLNPAAIDDLPPPRSLPAGTILPIQTSADDAVQEFLQSFGATRTSPITFVDKAGEPLIISDALFTTSRGNLKVTKRGRQRYVRLLAEAIREPDEIWLAWEYLDSMGEYRIRRRYISQFTVAGQSEPGMAVFEVSADGWTGVTAFRPELSDYLQGQRRGWRIYRREE